MDYHCEYSRMVLLHCIALYCIALLGAELGLSTVVGLGPPPPPRPACGPGRTVCRLSAAPTPVSRLPSPVHCHRTARMSRLRISVVQACPPLTPTSTPTPTAPDSPSPDKLLALTLNKLDALLADVAAQGSAFAVFPEAFIGGYPKYSTFGASIGDRQPAGRSEYAAYHSLAIPLPPTCALPVPLSLPSPTSPNPYAALQRILRLSQKHNVYFVIGVIERDGGTLYCTLLSVDPAHGLVGKRRKLVPTAAERVVWGMGQAEGLGVLCRTLQSGQAGRGVLEKVDGAASGAQAVDGDAEKRAVGQVEARISAAVCWENYMPLLRTHFYAQHVQLYCAPTVDARPAWLHTMCHIALEGRCFVLSACQFSTQANYSSTHPLPLAEGEERDPEGIVIAGGSCIISPAGEVLAGPLRGREGVLTVEVDLEECTRGKMDLDVVGHYARPDIFRLTVSAGL
ncbi:carbon-nitrogen hydrolase [Calocera cornea HHB12733]|uniref:Carbon-nitrogen hydrolase n=1 Tax=Calocera cornea HHB12733 TaxID=1353952 RepID=A0A165FRA9_9BASI|nr:carbon-nitrogen hydrolase [Calocera cornea HHB12733]